MTDNPCIPCGGACCKSIIVNLTIQPGDDVEWMNARGTFEAPGRWRVETRCRHLTDAGLCGIYETRPISCKVYEVGGRDCLAARRADGQEVEV